jgi:sec-independent protein translocase protein TatB
VFDIGFSELLVIGVVLLVVVGPERLPGVARTAGLLLGRLQRYVSGVKADIQRELRLEELKKFQQQTVEFGQSISSEINSIGAEVREALAAPEDIAPEDAAKAEIPACVEEVVTETVGMDSADVVDVAANAEEGTGDRP